MNVLGTWTLVALLFTLVGCASAPKPTDRTGKCAVTKETNRKAVKALDRFSDLVEAQCFNEALRLGEVIRKNFRDKSYSVTSEVFSVFVPEDSLSEYVLESYERAYLSLLMATVYLALEKPDDAAVELRQSYAEGTALIYNFGEDPVNALLTAALWEQIGDADSARPFWGKLATLVSAEVPVGSFARERIATIDAGSSRSLNHLRIYAVGRFPLLNWHVHLARKESGFYSLSPKLDFPDSCRSSAGVLLSTKSWLRKIEARYSADYHPLLNMKSWIRFPIGLIYGVTTATFGLGVAVSGCVTDAAAKGNGELCKASITTGGYLMSKSGDVTNYALEPDMRHWSKVPMAVLVSTDEASVDACVAELDARSKIPAIELGRSRVN